MWVILWPRPTMMPDRMGIIGNTQGVRASSKPAPKKNDTISQKLPPSNSLAMRVPSLSAGAVATSEGAALTVCARVTVSVFSMGG